MKKEFLLIMLVLPIFALNAQTDKNRDLLPVTSMSAQNDGSDKVTISWDYPQGYTPSDIELTWTNGGMGDQTGAPTSYYDWSVAQRFDTVDIKDYVGWRLKSISLIPCTRQCVYSLQAWLGDIDNLIEVLNQTVEDTTTLMEINTIEIETDVRIENGMEFWYGYNIKGGGAFPIALDEGPVVAGKGDMDNFSGEGWISFYQMTHVDRNFWIKAVIESPDGRTLALGSGNDEKDEELTGYKVYADNILLAEIDDVTTHSYIDNQYFNKGFNVEYCVTAVYGDMESEAECAMVEILSDEEITISNNQIFTVYPNPSHDVITIEGAEIAEIEVFNITGQKIETVENSNTLNVSKYQAGVYCLRIKDKDGRSGVGRVEKR